MQRTVGKPKMTETPSPRPTREAEALRPSLGRGSGSWWLDFSPTLLTLPRSGGGVRKPRHLHAPSPLLLKPFGYVICFLVLWAGEYTHVNASPAEGLGVSRGVGRTKTSHSQHEHPNGETLLPEPPFLARAHGLAVNCQVRQVLISKMAKPPEANGFSKV